MNAMHIKSHIARSLSPQPGLSEDELLTNFGIPTPHIDRIRGQWEPVEDERYDPTCPHTLVGDAPLALGANFPSNDMLVVAGFNGDCMIVWGFLRVGASE